MTDRPSIERQLADVIEVRLGYNRDLADAISRFIIVCVNDGRCDPIVPEGWVTIHADDFEAMKANIVAQDAELAELRALRERLEGCQANAGEVTIGRGRTQDAEALLYYLRR